MTDPTSFDHRGTLIDWITWATRGTIGVLGTAVVAISLWGFNAESRIANAEKFDARIAKLEAREDNYTKLALDIAVVQTKLDAQDRQLERIAKLLEARQTP